MSENDVRDAVRTAIGCAGGLRQLAKSWDVSPSYLSDFVNGRRGPGESILRHFGLKKVVTVAYEPSEAARDWPKTEKGDAHGKVS